MLLLALAFGWAPAVHAIKLSNDFEIHLINSVSTSWQTVNLQNTYTNAIPVCTYVLRAFNAANPPAVTRIRNITATSFDLRIQGWEDSFAATSDVHCIIADEGVHTLSNGHKFEAHTVLSDKTSGQYSTDGAWNLGILENISGAISHTYTQPVIVGQVISYNDNRASVFYNNDCDSRVNPAFHAGQADGACVGKHIGMIPGTRLPETIGYIVTDTGSGTVNNIFFEAKIGTDSVAGNGNVPDTYPMARHHNIAVLSQGAEDGGNGSWAVLYGNDPLDGTNLDLQVDEEVFAGDTTRRHTNEQVFYWAFAAAEITLTKKLVNDGGGTAVITDFVLTATGPDTISGTQGGPSVTEAAVHPGSYVLTETNIPGYVSSGWSCTGVTSQNGNKISLTGGDIAECVIVNDDIASAVLTLVKKVSNAKGGGTAVASDFTLAFDDGAGTSNSGITGAAAVTSVTVPPGTFTLTENPVAGYALTGITCDGTDTDGLDGLTLAAGEKVTCVFVNDDQTIDLTIAKSVSDTTPNIGDVLTFSLTVTNSGPDTATNVAINDVVKAGFSYQAASISGGTLNNDSDPGGAGLSWSLASLAPGGSAVLTFQASVLAP